MLYPYQDREAPYKEWHRTLPGGLYCCNFDQVEYAKTPQGVRPVALIELTKTNNDFADLPQIWARVDPDGTGSSKMQAEMMRWVGAQLRIPTFVTVFNDTGGNGYPTHFAVRDLMPHRATPLIPIADAWNMMDAELYEDLLRGLRRDG